MTAQWSNLDPGRRERIERALTVSAAGSVLLQTFINRVVQQIHLRKFGVQTVLSRRPGSGSGAFINRRAPGTTGAEWVSDTDGLTIEEGTYTQTEFPYKTLATRGRVTRFLQARGRSYGDVLAEEMTGKVNDWSNAYESALLVGDTVADSNQINGMLTLINAVSGQVVSQTTATAGDDLTLAKLDEAIDLVKGSDSRRDVAIIGSDLGVRKLNAALQSQQQFNDRVEIAAGFRVRTYDDAPIIHTSGMPNDLTWDGSNVQVFSGGATTALVIINLNFWWIEELTAMTVLPLAKTDSQFDEFDIFSDSSAVFANTLGGVILGGISGS